MTMGSFTAGRTGRGAQFAHLAAAVGNGTAESRE